ncbi:dihydroorotate dehydrogenase-like protein [Nostocoides sp. F2B08]|uniref:dihydroorotate dehydrogenase-like protein n=1 Tax=Nostocoides sp. F2B08 TaxID=2653936 RepID=UPI001262DD7D|nr:dihydroorotate dehydrogenase-like protein [Tetrasphaera sp. F2B08]KAB7741944.1 dihydroorotate dehydrogenase-like protein [Tetrasphaera sp. F2B08]
MDLTTAYLGLTLRSPLVASASPVTSRLDRLRMVEDAGVGAVVLPSLFEEQVRQQELADLELTERHEHAWGEAQSYLPGGPDVDLGGTAPYLRHVERAAAALEIPVIASLNGSTPGGWTGIARSMETAGAAAIELNVYAVPGRTSLTGAEVEARHLDIVGDVVAAVSVPVAVKLSPYFSSTAAVAAAIVEAGASGLVLFNRFVQPDVDVEALTVHPYPTLSTRDEGRLARTWIALLHGRLGVASLAATTGVETAEDVAADLLAGADVVMSASALLRHGPGYAVDLTAGLQAWAERKGFASLDAVRGALAVGVDADGDRVERAGYVAALAQARAVYGDLTVES